MREFPTQHFAKPFYMNVLLRAVMLLIRGRETRRLAPTAKMCSMISAAFTMLGSAHFLPYFNARLTRRLIESLTHQ